MPKPVIVQIPEYQVIWDVIQPPMIQTFDL